MVNLLIMMLIFTGILMIVEISHVSGQGLTFTLKGRTIAAGSDVVITDIGEGTNALICMTDLANCCRTQKLGEWILSNGTTVGNSTARWDFYRNRSSQQVLLHRRNNAMGPLGPTCCDVPTMAGPESTACINMVGPPPLTVTLRSSSVSQRVGESYTLTCIASEGGIITPTYQWHRNGVLLTEQTAAFSPPTRTSQSLTFSPLREADTGVYNCTVTRDSLTVSSSTITIEFVTVSVTQGGTPTEGSPFTLTCMVSGHHILMATSIIYQWSTSSGGCLEGVTNGTSYTFNRIDRDDSGNYTCQVTISSSLLNIMEQSIITLQVTVPLPEQPSNVEVSSQGLTSITVTWTQPSSGGNVDNYTVQYSASVRRCGATQSRSMMPGISNNQRMFDITNLEEDSEVSVTITAVNIMGTNSAMVNSSTLTASPTGMVQNLLTTDATFYSITMRWDPLNCVDRNGDITEYKVQYSAIAIDNMQMVTGTSFTATRLLPLTTYMFSVAAVNSNGTGPYSTAVTGQTTANTVTVTVSGSGTPTEGSQYTLTCNVSGHPTSSSTVMYQWFNNSMSLQDQSGRMLTFSPIDRYDNGSYTCQVTISSSLLSSIIEANKSIMIQISVPAPASPADVVASQRPRSITLSWTQPSFGSNVDSYTIEYSTYAREHCRDISPTQSVPITGISTTQKRYEITNLEEDSEVSVTITAVNIGGTSSTMLNTSTLTARPGLPQNLRNTSVTSSNIMLEWDELSCVDHNGRLTGYRVEYGTTTFDNMTTLNGTSFTATGLLPLTTYMFRVAAVNSNGTGPNATIRTNTSFPPMVTLKFRNMLLSNQSIVSLEEIQGGNDLFCLTNHAACCRASDGGLGTWYYPNNSVVPGSNRNGFSRNRAPSSVALTSSGSGSPPSGLYHCVFADSNDQNVTLLAGIYQHGQGSPSITAPIEHNFTSSTLTCISSGGPATTVTWTRDNVPISQSTSTQQQRLTDTSTATYRNLLTITSTNIRDYSGTFTCTVGNSRGSSNIQSKTVNATKVTGNSLFELNQMAIINCTTPVPVQTIQWHNVSSGGVISSSELRFLIVPASNNTQYRCEISDGGFTESKTITIEVGDRNSPRVPKQDIINAVSTSNTINISWTFTTMLDFKNETFTVKYGTTPVNLNMTSDEVQATPTRQEYSLSLVSLCPATEYHYQIHSTNSFQSRSSEKLSIRTMDARPTAVTNVEIDIPDNTALILTWEPPVCTNGELFTVNITGGATMISAQNISELSFTASNLSAGVAYNINIIPVNSVGQGEFSTTTRFTQELIPNVTIKNVTVIRSSPTTMNVSWRTLTLSEARGFVTFYSIAYTPTPNSRRRQAPQDTMYVNASADSSSVTIQGLDGDLAYSVTVAGGTRAGIGVASEGQIVEVFPTSTTTTVQGSTNSTGGSTTVGIAAGVAVGVLLVLLLTCILLICVKCKRSKKDKSSKDTAQYLDRKSSPSRELLASSREATLKKDDLGTKESEGMDENTYENTGFIVKDRMKSFPVEEFGEHVARMHADRDKWFELEYNSIDKLPQSKYDVAEIPENRDRNRFGNIYPYDFNRVILKKLPAEKYSDYINASFVDGYRRKRVYIGAQGPTDNSLEDFWRMIWEYRLPTLVMLTRIYEGRKKCEAYWPENADSPFVPCPGSPLTVEFKSFLPFAEFVIRKMVVTHADEPNTPPLHVTLYHYLAWPDHGVPSNAFSMINFIRRVRKAHPYSKEDTLLVHCSAGVGRTGTFITLDYMLERIRVEKNINIYEFVTNLRKQRVLMVQTVVQYIFIHNALDELLTCGETEIAAANMRVVIGRLSRMVPGKNVVGFKAQLEVLDQVTSEIKNADNSNATSEVNTSKNRYQDKLPYNHSRVRLRPSAMPGSDYINACFVDGYRQKGAYIATQGPLPNTVNDFWRMIWEKEVKCIVMLCKTEEKEKEVCHQYWPHGRGNSETYGKYTVTFSSQEICNDFIVRKMEISDSQLRMSVSNTGFTVTQFQYLKWPEDGVPQSTTGVLEVANLVQKVQMGSGNKAIVVMCNDGVGRTGAFIATHAEMERMKAETVVDLFQFIKAARVQREGLVSNKEQYEFCHQVVADFLDCFDTYANFKEII